MIIDVSQNKITISNPNLTPLHRRQLSFWEFRENADGFLYLISENTRSVIEKLVSFFDKEDLKYEFTNEALEFYRSIKKSDHNFADRKEILKNLKEGYFDKNSYKEFNQFLERNIKRKLKEHQKKAAFHLYLAQNGANFSVPGSGKTSVVLAVYEKLKIEGKVDTLFVIGPPASFGTMET